MPLIWRYLLKSYFRVFLLCVGGFVAILLVTRLKDIARFSALATNIFSIIMYIIYQIPHILPIAIPISCLISSMLLFQNMSRSFELTALRASGLSLKDIIAPLFLAGIVLSLINFFISSELTPRCRYKSKEIIYRQSSINPIVLLQRQPLLKIKNSYIDMRSSADENRAKNLFFILKNKSSNRLNLIYCDQIELEKDKLVGTNVSIISHLKSENDTGFDNLIIENQEKMITKADSLSKLMKPNKWALRTNFLPMRMLLVKNALETNVKRAFSESIYVELARRISLAMAAFSFTFIGICFGIEISRTYSKKGLIQASVFSLLIFISFIVGKALKYYTITACLTYVLPQIIVLFFAYNALKKISRGLE
jgi:lipopolysaccharide export system permease protein